MKTPCTQHEYSASIRKNLQNITQIANSQLEKCRSVAKQQFSNKRSSSWAPLPVGQSVWLHRPKTWKCGRRWIGLIKLFHSLGGVNYRIQSDEGKEKIVHHNNVKASRVPWGQGQIIPPVREAEEIIFSENLDPFITGERPAEPLRQD